ncbi:MAG: glycoside hydrolase family 13 protein, partial [Clostridia bacterium]|nr:glycoside hydrolase family 13 protein [Clostridia bacterium]
TIYLSPVFDAYSNHKYDGGDYLTVDSMFGGDEALSELCAAARERGINIILDGVFNHTGDDSVYFNKYGRYDSVGAYQSEDSPYRSWYSFGDTKDDYESWWGIKILPRVDSSHPDFQCFICDRVVDKWMKMGVFGWRLDVADELSEDFLMKFRDAVKERNPDGVIIGEVWEDATDKVSYGARRAYLSGGELDSVMNYPLRAAIIEYVKLGNCDFLRHCTEGTYRRYPKCSSDNLMNFLGTHDTERIITILGGVPAGDKTNEQLSMIRMTDAEKALAASKLKLAYSIIAGLPGVPCVFYGDEAGLEGYRDPFCRRPYPWNDVNQNLLEHYRKIGMIRQNTDVFRDGLFRIISLTDSHFVYERTPFGEGDRKVIVASSRKGELHLDFDDTVCAALSECNITGEHMIGEGCAEYFICGKDVKFTRDKIK